MSKPPSKMVAIEKVQNNKMSVSSADYTMTVLHDDMINTVEIEIFKNSDTKNPVLAFYLLDVISIKDVRQVKEEFAEKAKLFSRNNFMDTFK